MIKYWSKIIKYWIVDQIDRSELQYDISGMLIYSYCVQFHTVCFVFICFKSATSTSANDSSPFDVKIGGTVAIELHSIEKGDSLEPVSWVAMQHQLIRMTVENDSVVTDTGEFVSIHSNGSNSK